ncbi:MAG: radical SAM protein [Anaerolineaceae bacterium]|nr:radical SAM protein [Anaerolineaceae bacterium]
MSWKRVLCLYPYAPDKKSEQLYGGMAIINPIGLEVVATAAARQAEVMVVDLRLESEPLEKLIARFRPDLIAVSMNWGRDEHIDRTMAGLGSDATLMIGGIHPTRHPEEYLEAYPTLDLLAIGYGEKTIAELLAAGSPENVRGLWFRRRAKAWPPHSRSQVSGDGRLQKNDYRWEVDASSFHVDRSLRRYTYPWMNLKGDNVATSIGCPMVCAFCGWRTNIYGEPQKWFPRSAEDVVDEIAETEADVVHIVDANFAHDTERVERICDLLIERDIRRLLACEIRVNALSHNLELVKKMEQAGFFMFMVGIEATDDAILKKMKKGYTVKMCRQAFEHLRQTHILTLGNFIIGTPGQTREEMLQVADYARELGLDFISPNKLYAYPNSAFREWVLEHPGYRIEGRRQYVVSDAIGLRQLKQIQRKIYLRFFKPAHLWRFYRKALSHPMVLKMGRQRIRRAMLRTLYDHLADARFRRRLLKKMFGRFNKKRRRHRAAAL